MKTLTRVQRSRVAWGLLASALLIAAAVLFVSRRTNLRCDSVYSSDASPDGRFAVTVCRTPSGAAMPGQGGDAPGIIQLVDVRTGAELERISIEMVQLFPGAAWDPRRVTIQNLVEWDLPTR